MAISSALGSQALVPAGFGFRNLIINGEFNINQRGFSSTTTSGTYGFDRWFILGTGGTTTYSSQSFTAGNPISGEEPTNFARVVTTGQSASGDLSILIQRIENVRNCAGQTVTISFWAKASSGSPKVAVEVDQNFGTGGSPSSAVYTLAGSATLSTTWNRYFFTVNVPSISGKTFGSNPDSYLALNLWVSGGSSFNTRTNSLGIQSNTFDFWGVQVEQNLVPTSFEHRPIGIETMLCQRYYTSLTDPPLRGVFNASTSFGRLGGCLPVRMRTAPVVTMSGTLNIYDGSNVGTFTTIGVYYSTVDTIEIDSGVATGTFGINRPCILYVGGNGKVNCSSEF